MTNEHGADASTQVQVRMSGELFERLEDWRRHQPALPARAAAVRTLLAQVLGTAAPTTHR